MDNNSHFLIDDEPEEAPRKPSTLNLNKDAGSRPGSSSTGSRGGYSSAPAPQPGRDNTRIVLVVIICVLAAALIGCGIWFMMANKQQDEQIATIQAEKEAVEVSYQEDLAKQDMETLENEFAGIESPRTMVVNDEVKKRLTEEYGAAKLEIERLQKRLRELSDRKPTTQAQAQQNSAEIGELRGQIATLRALLKHYVEEINRLNEENQVLRTQNETLSVVNQRLTSRVEETSRENATLNERMTLAEKLNVTGVNIHALNAKGKNEKKIEKAKRLSVSFTIPQNNSTPVGEKVIFMRITTPEGQLLGGGGSFSFEGGSLAASARKTIEYGGQEIGGITIYYDVRQALNPGTYTVELFCDNYRLCSRSFNLN